MKKIFALLFTVASMMAAVSCNTFEEQDIHGDETSYVTRKYSAGFDETTRTSLDDEGKVSWKQGDVIRYYSRKSGEVKSFTITEDSARAEMDLDVASTASFLIGVYGGTGLADNLGGSVTIQGAIPAVQSGVFGDHHVAITKTYDVAQERLTFHNLVSYLKFTLTRDDVAKVVFKANDGVQLHGSGIKVAFATDSETVDDVSFTGTAGSRITVNNGGAGTFYIATLPCTMNAGFKLDLFDANGDIIGSVLTGKSAQLSQGKILNLGVLDSRIKTYNMEYVDLGLSAKWAKCNIGANVAEEGGDLYAWGEITTKSQYGWENYKWSNNGQWHTFSKYSSGDSMMAEDDVATCLFGDKWSIPTMAEWDELKQNCTWTLTTLNGIAGYRVVSDINGNEIFIPSNDCGHILEYSKYVFSYWRSDDLYMFNVEGLHEFIDDDYYNMANDETTSCAYGPSLGRPVRAIYERNSRPVQSRVDLSATGTANSYIVTEAGNYKFKANVKGNSTTALDGTPYRAEVLWESFGTDTAPSVGDLVSNVTFKDGYIFFKASELKGNAVIAVENRDEDILWSWHIWMTDQPAEQIYKNGAGTVMDRNLGATSATKGDVRALGLMYQWGRKDPFLSGQSTSWNPAKVESTITWPSAVPSNSSNGTIDFVVMYPTTFVTDNSNNYDWYYTGSSSTDDTRWNSDKGMYDPCPKGWKVPDGGSNGLWAKAIGSSSSYGGPWDGINYGIDFAGIFSAASEVWYPASGYISYRDGTPYAVGLLAGYWSCTPSDNSALTFGFSFDNSDRVYTSGKSGRANGSSVRCVKQ